MAQKSVARLFGSVLSLIVLFAFTATAQNKPSKSVDAEVDRVQGMINQAKKEAEQFSKSGGAATDAKHPNLKWATTLWRYRSKHPNTPAATLATIEVFRLLGRADRVSELQAKADSLKLTDPAWKQILYVLLGAAARHKDYSYFLAKAGALADGAPDPDLKGKARFMLGEGYWKKGDIDQARIVFRAVLTQFPNSSYAEEAEGNLWEIEALNIGQSAPSFERTTIDGTPMSLANLKGKVVVLKFWGTY